MIFGAKEEIIPKYYDDDKPKSVQKTAFGLVRIILLWLHKYTKLDSKSRLLEKQTALFYHKIKLYVYKLRAGSILQTR